MRWEGSWRNAYNSGSLSLKIARIEIDRVDGTLRLDVPRTIAAPYHNRDLAVQGTMSRTADRVEMSLRSGGFLYVELRGDERDRGTITGGDRTSDVHVRRTDVPR
jgi:hypothetical protein